MTINNYSSEYSFSGIAGIRRILSDDFSRIYGNAKEAKEYSIEKTDGRCFYCGVVLYKTKNNVRFFSDIAHDHIYPASRWGLYVKGNVAITCWKCNSDKSDKDPIEFAHEMINNKGTTFYSSIDEFNAFFNEFQKPYRETFPEYYDLAVNFDPENADENEICMKYFLGKNKNDEYIVPVKRTKRNLYIEDTVDADLWLNLRDPESVLYEGKTQKTAQAMAGRIHYIQKAFFDLFPADKSLRNLTNEEFLSLVLESLTRRAHDKYAFADIKKVFSYLMQLRELEHFNDVYETIPGYKGFLDEYLR